MAHRCNTRLKVAEMAPPLSGANDNSPAARASYTVVSLFCMLLMASLLSNAHDKIA
jgi:hypothetical protein